MSHTKGEINRAGEILKNDGNSAPKDIEWAEQVLTYWRTQHSHIIVDFHNDLKKVVEKVNKDSVIVQRIKRTHSIIAKLNRIDGMKLARMQDIAGIRVIVENVSEVYELMKTFEESDFEYELKNCKDYIKLPKESGYRGIHLIYKCPNGLHVEVQIRTKTQHIWATAVETMSTFLGTHLKFDEGQPKWLKYFALTSSAFAFMEQTQPVPKYENLSEEETLRMAMYEYNYNKIDDSLSGYSVAAKVICENEISAKKAHVVTLNIEKKNVSISSFSAEELDKANKFYTQIEKENEKNPNIQSVFVSTDSIKELQEGFPNYFLDIRGFLRQMEDIKIRLNEMKK